MASKSKPRTRSAAAQPSDFLPAFASALEQIHTELSRLSAGHARSVLIVEDDLDAREILTAVLQHAGYSTVSAVDGRDALLKLKQVVPSLILLDLRMPGMDGWAFDRQIKLEPELRDIPVIVVSAFARFESSKPGIEAAAWFQKPVDLDALVRFLPRIAKQTEPLPAAVRCR